MRDHLLNTSEVAELFRTSPETIRYWRHTGYGPKGRKVGRRVLYDAAEVQAFWDSLPSNPEGSFRGDHHVELSD